MNFRALPDLRPGLAGLVLGLLVAGHVFGSSASISPAVPVSGSAVIVTYISSNGPLSNASTIYVYPGINGYAVGFAERAMKYNSGSSQYTCTFWISEITTTLNLSFTDGNGNWDNNNNANWNFTVTPAPPPSTITPPSLSSSASKAHVMMEGFYWNVPPGGTWYATMTGEAVALRNMEGGQGIDRIWFPPPSKGQTGGLSMGYDPYDYYDLGAYNQEGTTATLFGTQAQLISTIQAFKAQNVACVADIVLNHRSGGASETNPNVSGSSTFTDFSGVASGMCTWHYNQFHPSTYEYNDDGVFGTFPDICHITGTTTGSARYDLLTWGEWLTSSSNAGFDGGWRFDYALGYRPTMVAAFRAATNNAFGVMECEYTNPAILDRYVTYSGGASTFDFGLYDSLVGVCASGTESIADLVNPDIAYAAHNPSNAVTFVANHDTDLITSNKMLAYAFILTYQGYPCIFWYDYFNNGLATLGGLDGNGINRLVWVRGALAGGQPSIQVLKDDDPNMLVYGTLAGSGTAPGYITVINDDPVNSRTATVTTSNPTLAGRTLRCCAWYSYVTGSNVQPAAVTSNAAGAVTVEAPPSGYAVFGPSLALTNTSAVTSGTSGYPYSAALGATGGTPPYTFVVANGSLPSGLNLSSAGVLSGTPGTTGTFDFSVQATDATGLEGIQSFAISTAYLPPVVVVGSASAVGGATAQVIVTGTVNPNGGDATAWFEYGLTTSYGNTTRSQASDNAESYTAWDYGADSNGGSGFGPASYLSGIGGGIFLADAAAGGLEIDGSNSFAIYSGTGGQALCRSILSPHQVGTYTLSAIFDVSNTNGFSGFNLKSARGSTFIANELLAFGMMPATGGNAIIVRDSGTQAINLGAAIPGSIIDFQLYYDAPSGAYTLGAKFRSSSSYTMVSGTMEAIGQDPAVLGFENMNTGTVQNLIFDDLQLIDSDSVGSGTSSVPVSATLSGLQASAIYHYRAAAQNAGGITYGVDRTFGTPALISTASPLPGGVAGAAYSQTFVAGGGFPPLKWSVVSGSLPPGLTLSGSGVLSGTPTTSGTFAFGIQTSDGTSLPTTAQFSLPVALGVTNISSITNGSIGISYSVSLGATGGVGPYSFLLISGTLPPGLSLSSAGVLSGTPTSTGTYSVTVQVTDSDGLTGSQAFTLSTAYLLPAAITGDASAVGASTTQAITAGTVNPNASESTGWFEYGLTTSYGNTTRSQASDNAESYTAWDYGADSNGGVGFGPATYLSGSGGGIFLVDAAAGGAEIDGSNSFGIYSSTGGQALCRSILSPHQVGTYTLSAVFDVDNTTGFSGFNLKSAQGSMFIANELLAFGLNPSAGNNAIFVRGSTNQTINLGSAIPGSIIDFQLNYDAFVGTYTLGAKFRPNSRFTTVSGTMESIGQDPAVLGFENMNTGSFQNLIFDDLWLINSDSLGSGTASVLISSTLSALQPNTIYHYHTAAQNTAGIAYGVDQTFGTDIVTAAATTPDAYEAGPVAGTFTISQTGTAGISVNYNIGGSAAEGTRFTINTSPLAISSGTSGTIAVTPIPSDIYYGNQTAVLTLASGTNYLPVADGSATVTIHDTPFNIWKYSNFGANANNAAISGPAVDTDDNGVPNLVEFLLGGNPGISNSNTGILPTAVVRNGSLTVSFTILANLGTVTWSVEYSSDLSTWTTAVNGQNGVTISSSPVSGGDFISVTIPENGSHLFTRLRANSP